MNRIVTFFGLEDPEMRGMLLEIVKDIMPGIIIGLGVFVLIAVSIVRLFAGKKRKS